MHEFILKIFDVFTLSFDTKNSTANEKSFPMKTAVLLFYRVKRRNFAKPLIVLLQLTSKMGLSNSAKSNKTNEFKIIFCFNQEIKISSLYTCRCT